MSHPLTPDQFPGPEETAAGLRSQLHGVPAFRALLRAAESALLEAEGPFEAPMFDLGCGDGHYACVTPGFEGSFGLDPVLTSLAAASKQAPYAGVVAGSATELPFENDTFETVIPNSVLEHIPDLDTTLAEVARVLRPGGRFLITSPSHRFTDLLLGTSLMRGVGLAAAAKGYGRWFNTHSQHFHTLSADEWSSRLDDHGFRVDHWHYYFPARAHRVFDLLHYLGVPTVVAHRLTGRWVPWRNPLTLALAMKLLGPLCDPRPVADGAYIFVSSTRKS